MDTPWDKRMGGWTVKGLIEAYRKGELAPKEAIEALSREIDSREPQLNAFINLFLDEALERAAELGKHPPEPAPALWGVPIAVKDNIAYADHETTCASRILLGYKPPYTATALQRLLDAGAIVVGKTNMDEFAMGSTGEYSYFGPTSNPLDPERVTGGSSSGSAAAVGAGLVPLALGSDTGGSIRQPAAWCGAVGFRPTYGRVSRWGLVAFASSLDQIGPITRSVEDAALALALMAGPDGRDSTLLDEALEGNLLEGWESYRPKLGIPKEYLEGVDLEIAGALDEAVRRLEAEGVKALEVSLPHTRYGVYAYQLIAAAEASANLARYDGVRYGYRHESEDLEEMYVRTRTEGFGPEVKRRIVAGTFVLSAGYHEEFFVRAQRVRRLVAQDFTEAFREVELLLTPTTATLPPKKGEGISDPIAVYMMDALTAPSALAGLPAISVPVPGRSFPTVGLQVIGPFGADREVLKLARLIEKVFS